METKTDIVAQRNKSVLYSIVNYYISVSFVESPYTGCGPAVHTATHTAMPEHIAFTVS
jgi:hypothetical protein